MTVEISDTLISRLSSLVNSRTGLYFPREKWRDLRRNIQGAAPDLGFTDTEACIRWILSTRLTQEQVDILVGHLTIGETFFFRDHVVFETLKDRILTPWSRSRNGFEKRLRFWSAACCTGEEPYSIAMLLDEMAGLFQGWEIRIMATDINARFIEKAEKGVYSQWSFRDMPERLMARYFTKTGKNQFDISSHIKKMVTFSQLNLIEEGPVAPPGGGDAVDVIFCRNALMYLSPDMRERVIGRLTSFLATDGWLIVSPSETSFVQAPGLHPVRFPGAVLHKKGPPGPLKEKTAEVVFTPLTPGKINVPEAEAAGAPLPSRTIISSRPGKTYGPGPTPALLKREKGVEDKSNRYGEALALYEMGSYQEVTEKLGGLLSDERGGAHPFPMQEAMALLARACANLGRLEEARKWCEKAVSVEKLNPDYHALLAAIYQELGLTEEAIASLKRAIYLDPGRIMAYFSLGHLMRQQDRTIETKRFFKNALDLLSSMDPGETVPHSDGLTVERLREVIELIDGLRQPANSKE
ncbi:MAG: CheR family methyltransferase [Candidatus Desulfacyla sp.]